MNAPKVEIDADSGFCFGVVTAIRKAEEELAASGVLYCLGDIVHNSDEVERLRSKGLKTITHDDIAKLHGVKVLLRAHGEPPSTYDLARRNNIEIIDATCPVVLQLQRRIKSAYVDSGNDRQIVIYGKSGHAEVNGLVGQTEGKAIVVEDVDGLNNVDFSANIDLYSQTTKSPEGLRAMIAEINRRKAPDTTFRHFDTICRQVSSRVDKLKSFAASHSVVIFVSGAKSSNGRVLFSECKAVNQSTYLISNKSQIDAQWFEGAESIGVCGATSTPRWIMEDIRDEIMRLTQKS